MHLTYVRQLLRRASTWGIGGGVAVAVIAVLLVTAAGPGTDRNGVSIGARPSTSAGPPAKPAATVNVRDYQTDGRSDAAAISAAMGAARPGDTVFFPGGPYILNEPFYFASDITVLGDPTNPPTVIGAGDVSIRLRHTVERPLRNVVIRGLRFSNVELSLDAGASYGAIVNITLKDCVFSSGRKQQPWASEYIWLAYTEGVTVDGCTFLRDSSSGGRGVVLERTHGTVIKDSFFGTTRDLEAGTPSGYFKTAINVLGYDAATGDRNEGVVIDGNVFRRVADPPCPAGIECEDHGIYAWGAKDLYIGGNFGDGWTNTSAGGALKLRNSENVTVTANHFMASGILSYTHWHSNPRHLRDIRIGGNRIDLAGAGGSAIFYRRVDDQGSSVGATCRPSDGERDIQITDNSFVDGGAIDVRCANGSEICISGNEGAYLSLLAPAVRTADCPPHTDARPFAGVHRGDLNGDGREDFVRSDRSAAGSVTWRAQLSAGNGFVVKLWTGAELAPDAGRYGLLIGDFNGDGRDDLAYRGHCTSSAAGCWLLQVSTGDGISPPHEYGDGVRPSDDTFRFGFHVGDFTGDRRDDIAYRGVCGVDRHACWIVVANLHGQSSEGSDWGDGTYWNRVETDARGLRVGDYNGDGRDDIAYRGLCGSGTPCLRVHVSTGTLFTAENWGEILDIDERAAGHFGLRVLDRNGDGRDDIAFLGYCGESGTPSWRFHLGAPARPFVITC